MKHYICTGGCGGVSKELGYCQAKVCVQKGHPFVECDCVDGKHAGLIKACQHCGKLCEGKCEVEPFKEELH